MSNRPVASKKGYDCSKPAEFITVFNGAQLSQRRAPLLDRTFCVACTERGLDMTVEQIDWEAVAARRSDANAMSW